MAKLYSNENFPLPVAEELRRLGHDVVTIQDRGHGSEAVADSEVLDWAIRESRTVITLNRRDFIRLHRERPAHTGIVVCTVDPDFEGQAARIHEALVSSDFLHGRLIRVNRPNQ